MKAFIWTDGSCLKNNHGGWAFIFRYNNIDWEVSGNDTNTTNNRMELKAVINSITFSKDIKELIIFTDSKYKIIGKILKIKIFGYNFKILLKIKLLVGTGLKDTLKIY